MRISDLRKNGCFRGYDLSRFTPCSLRAYEPLKPLLTSRCDSDPVFYVHQGHLPTHMRSLRLSRYTDQRLTRHAPARARRFMVTGGVLALFLVSVLCFLLSLYYWGNKGYDAPPSLEDPESKVSTAYDKFKPERINIERNNTLEKIKIKANYESIVNYKNAKYGDCYIEERNDSPVGVYNGGIRPTVYSCRSAANGRNKVHVFSNFGNSASNETTVEISRDSPDPVSVVLSNYHKVHWRVVLRGTLVPNIYLVSRHHLRRSTVRVETERGMPGPPVNRVFSHVGYGEDQYGGHTVSLLRTVSQRVGHISSFTGVASADRWTVNLDTL
uniref:Uncharacterized protein n=1 Tax=Magallana gigas TaxID=29159 RepID=K1QBS1_MAGGI